MKARSDCIVCMMKQALNTANKNYKRAYDTNLYDIKKSERFSFLPHITLGSLRENYIKYLINDKQKENEVVARVKERIQKVISEAIAQMSDVERSLSFESISIYSAKTKKYVHSRKLKR